MLETLGSLALAAGHDIRSVVRNAETSIVSRPEYWLASAMGGGPTMTGVRVGPGNAMQSPAVTACVRLKAQSIAMLPLFILVRDSRGGRSVAFSHSLYPLLKDAPNPWQTSFEWREMMQSHLELRGNAFSYVLRDGGGDIRMIIPLHPDYVQVLRAPDGEPFYRVTPNGYVNLSGVFGRGSIFHLRGMSHDGYTGMSPIAWHRETVGFSLACMEHGARSFANGASPRGVIEMPTALTPETAERLQKSWNDAYSGLSNAGKTVVLEQGMKWARVAMTNEDAQYLQLRGFTNGEIYRIFGVPPHMVGDVEKATSWGTGIEQMSLGFVKFTLGQDMVRWEQAINQMLLLPEERPTLYAKFAENALVRGDLKSRSEALAIWRQNGIINANEWRELEDMDPIRGEDGDIYLVNGNMIQPSRAGKQNSGKPPADKNSVAEDQHQALLRRIDEIHAQPIINVSPPNVVVHQQPVNVKVDASTGKAAGRRIFERDEDGLITGFRDEPIDQE